MTRRSIVKVRQLTLPMEQEEKTTLSEETREALIAALADLLLEALGEQIVTKASVRGDHDEYQDHT